VSELHASLKKRYQLMSFPQCRHRATERSAVAKTLQWMAAEPFRLFFFSGVLWSMIGVALWPLFYAGRLGFYPNYCHSRLMIEAFGGGFIVGFLGTAGPRMASAPKLTALELLWLFGLHQSSAICHLRLQHAWGDRLFILLLASLMLSLTVRVRRFAKEPPPPPMLLAWTGLLCGVVGAALHLLQGTWTDLHRLRLAGLLLNQGLMLLPVLGIGSFLFPRILGGDFGGGGSPAETARRRRRAVAAIVLVVGSFVIEAYGTPVVGSTLRAVTAGVYLLVEVPWRRVAGAAPRGSLAGGLRWALLLGFGGILASGYYVVQRIAIDHLLYVGGFGLLMLVVGSRVLFGHSGDLPGFERRGWFPRLLIFLGLLAAVTRMSPAFLPHLTISHNQYAAWTWLMLALLWMGWHRRRWLQREPE
jgi:uncharacterized protein involved in response to NO